MIGIVMTVTTQIAQPPTHVATQRPILNPAGLLTLLLGAALPMIDFFIVNVALSAIAADLHASTAALEMVVAAYGIAYSLLLVFGGRLGDTFGRRRLFVVGLAAFTATSLVCGLAPGIVTLIAARVAQGAAGALMFPQVLSMIQTATEGERRSSALGYYGATGGLAAVVGQVVGGALVTADIAGTGWRPIFLVNVPIGLAGLLLARSTLPETRSAHPLGVDGKGTAMFGVALLALLVPLTQGHALGWPMWTWLLLTAVPFVAVAFVAVERRLERTGHAVPLLPPSILRLGTMRKGLGIVLPFFTGFGGFMFVYAVVAQEALGLGAFGSGLGLAPLAAGFFATSITSSRLVARLGKRVIVLGAAVQAIGLLMLIATLLVTWPAGVLVLAPGMLVTGLGQGMVVATLFRVVLSQVPAERAGVGSGVLTTTQQTSLALGTALLGSLFAAVAEQIGMRDGFIAVMTLQVLAAFAIMRLASRLPDPRG